MTVTKKAKKVSVEYVETKYYYSKYICPSCHGEYFGNNITKNVLRFRCRCGQELIVKEN